MVVHRFIYVSSAEFARGVDTKILWVASSWIYTSFGLAVAALQSVLLLVVEGSIPLDFLHRRFSFETAAQKQKRILCSTWKMT